MFECIKGSKRDQEESPKTKSYAKVSEVVTSREKREISKGISSYTATIFDGAPQGNLPSKGTIKRKMSEMMTVYKIKGSSLSKISDRPMLGFRDSKKVGGISNEFIPLVITTTIGKFSVSRIILERGKFVLHPLFVTV